MRRSRGLLGVQCYIRSKGAAVSRNRLRLFYSRSWSAAEVRRLAAIQVSYKLILRLTFADILLWAQRTQLNLLALHSAPWVMTFGLLMHFLRSGDHARMQGIRRNPAHVRLFWRKCPWALWKTRSTQGKHCQLPRTRIIWSMTRVLIYRQNRANFLEDLTSPRLSSVRP